MTFSLLALDPGTGAVGGVAATGNLCVGGWVLRGDSRGGMTASQGLTPSTLWGEDALAALVAGTPAPGVVAAVSGTDPGRDARQLSAIDLAGRTAAFDGADNRPYTGHISEAGRIVAGNWLASRAVIEAVDAAFTGATGPFADRLLDALEAGVDAGSDSRGTLSAALLVVRRDRPPLTLRVDHDRDPIARLRSLYETSRAPEYVTWLETLPTRKEPHRT